MKRNIPVLNQCLPALRLSLRRRLKARLHKQSDTVPAPARSDAVTTWFNNLAESERNTRNEISRILGQRS
ncbi:hypothetical protein [Paraburkholderia sp. J8-2]|uniref:hypothetical protein n=1 Tax=Paraburkholderia sp. J8-2 TaxID=2805440 RepID=UPI002AB60551|nr:hypothetical protein [Paraburkholderia sp. J8-2]